MNNRQAYNAWSATYDEVENKTRDLEREALRAAVSELTFANVLELGCGTGKNTSWLASRAETVTGADFSAEMLEKARQKITAENVMFRQTDLRETWDFANGQFDLITCSLVLEHIEDLDHIFREAASVLSVGGHFYIGELHPFRQYQGGKARFETGSGVFELGCFTHHVSDFFAAANSAGFDCIDLREWFDDGDRTMAPRVLAMVFRKRPA